MLLGMLKVFGWFQVSPSGPERGDSVLVTVCYSVLISSDDSSDLCTPQKDYHKFLIFYCVFTLCTPLWFALCVCLIWLIPLYYYTM